MIKLVVFWVSPTKVFANKPLFFRKCPFVILESIKNTIIKYSIMSKKQFKIPKTPNLSKPLYLNANIIFSEAVCRIKNNKKGNRLGKLKGDGYNLVSSDLVKLEVIQNLRKKYNYTTEKAREMYYSIASDHSIVTIRVHDKVNLTPDYLDQLSKTNLSLKDAIHLDIARVTKMPVCSHDTAMAGESNFDEKRKYYDQVFRPEELITQRKKK